MAIHNWDYAPEALEVPVSELLLATADHSDELVDENVRLVLQELRQHLHMEVIFVSEIRNGQRMFQHVDTAPGKELIATGGGGPLEESFCQCVLDGVLPGLVHDAATHPAFSKLPATPFRVGAHLSTPIVLASGKVYGTLCCFSQAADESLTAKDLQKLECVAKITARRIDIKQAQHP
ncbi:GAF domain-containing protein [Comamonas testosteroni]|uniref:GAF domain-containing protein n=1 Tax=Comamonas testosteroni TaxID=285 RepID=UPI00030B8B56|nr:GAF domain-containing protein [Comamonas testosteroni]